MPAGHPEELPSSPGHQRPGEARQDLPGVAASGSGPGRGDQDPAPGGGRGESGSLHLMAARRARLSGAARAPTEVAALWTAAHLLSFLRFYQLCDQSSGARDWWEVWFLLWGAGVPLGMYGWRGPLWAYG